MEEKNQLNVLPMLSFGQAIKNVFSKYASFKGRARRSEYWWFQLFEFIIFFVAAMLDNVLNLDISDTGEGVFSIIIGLFFILPGLSLLWRRLHDTGRSGWNYLWVIVPVIFCCILAFTQLFIPMIIAVIVVIVMAVVLLVWCCMDSKPEENQYGPSPKYESAAPDDIQNATGDDTPETSTGTEIIQ